MSVEAAAVSPVSVEAAAVETSPTTAGEPTPGGARVYLALSIGPGATLPALLAHVDEAGLLPGAAVHVLPSQERSLSPQGLGKLARRLRDRGLAMSASIQLSAGGLSDLDDALTGLDEVWLRPAAGDVPSRIRSCVTSAQRLVGAGLRTGLELVADEEEASLAEEWSRALCEMPDLPVRLVPDSGADPGLTSLAAETLRRALSTSPVTAQDFPRCLVSESVAGPRLDGVGWDAWQAVASVLHIKPPGCAGCDLHTVCSGVTSESVHVHGDGALRPVRVDDSFADTSLRGVPIARVGDLEQPAETERLDISPRYPDTSLVTLIVPGCDLNCVFCEGEPDGVSLPPSGLNGVRSSLIAAASRCSGVYFTGGEPTQLPWLLDALQSARALGYSRIQMQSHAGRAAEPGYAAALVDAGLTAIDVPLYGHDAVTHEATTATPGSFDATVGGLRALQDRGVRVVVHVTLFQQNLPKLTEILRFMASLQPDGAYLQVTGEVGVPGTYEAVAPSPSAAAVAVARALDAVAPEFPVRVADIPRCLLPEHPAHVSRWEVPVEREAEALILPFAEWLSTFSAGRTRDYGRVCDACAVRAECDGLSREALVQFGDGELRPQ